MNNKGFMMAEVVVVSSIILVALASFYTTYNKIIAIYNQRLDYYDVATLYELASIRDKNNKDGTLSSKPAGTKIANGVYIVRKNDLDSFVTSSTNQTFKDYLSYLESSMGTSFQTSNILVMERCISTDNCKYAYLEVY